MILLCARENSSRSARVFKKEIKEALEYFEPQATKQYNLDYDPRAIVEIIIKTKRKFYGK